jgi:hypothetical protein
MPVIKGRKSKHMLAGVPALALASAVAAVLLPGAAAAEVTPRHENFSFPFEFQGFNPCNGEEIEFNGRFSGTVTEVVQPSGQIRVAAHQLLTAQGVGTTGNRYSFSDTLNSTFFFAPDNAPTVYTQITVDNVISEGNAPNFLLHSTNHLTINANGEVTASTFEGWAECKEPNNS